MIKRLEISKPNIAQKVLNLQIPSYRVEAEFIECEEIPPLKDTLSSLLQCGETFYGYYQNGELCGAISFKIENEVLDIHRVMVHPSHFRKGIAKSLLEYLQAHVEGYKVILVATGTKNAPAVSFYLKNGFTKMGEKLVDGGLSLTFFSKQI